eukprot:maker-scaffold_29-snap-gene-2.5-mRNA-1 protein AED:0.00 eAED:0.00 QI:84/1/1/1/1/1/2/91/224
MKSFLLGVSLLTLIDGHPSRLDNNCEADLSEGVEYMNILIADVQESFVTFELDGNAYSCGENIKFCSTDASISINVDSADEAKDLIRIVQGDVVFPTDNENVVCDGKVVRSPNATKAYDAVLSQAAFEGLEFNDVLGVELRVLSSGGPASGSISAETCPIQLTFLENCTDASAEEDTTFDKDPFWEVLVIIIVFIIVLTVGSLVFLSYLEARNSKKEAEKEAVN